MSKLNIRIFMLSKIMIGTKLFFFLVRKKNFFFFSEEIFKYEAFLVIINTLPLNSFSLFVLLYLCLPVCLIHVFPSFCRPYFYSSIPLFICLSVRLTFFQYGNKTYLSVCMCSCLSSTPLSICL